MLVLIDAGNTRIKCAIVEQGEITHTTDISTWSYKSAELLENEIAKNLPSIREKEVTKVIISSVVPSEAETLMYLAKLISNQEPFFIDQSRLNYGIKFKIDSPEELGADRKAAILGGYKRYGGDLIIFDFGTATTIEVTNSEGDYIGGAIAPGIGISKNALINQSERLHDFELKPPKSIVTTEADEAMRSGIYYSTVSMIEGISKRIQEQYNTSKKIIATGGITEMPEKWDLPVDITDKYLVFRGMLEIYNMNKI